MYRHILVATDGSRLSDKAVKQAIQFAKKLKARLTAIHVVSDYRIRLRQGEGFPAADLPVLQKRFDEAEAAATRKIFDKVRNATSKAGIACDTVAPAGSSAYEVILRQAAKSRCDLIVMGSHGRSGLQGLLLGSETAKVLSHSKIPVLVCR